MNCGRSVSYEGGRYIVVFDRFGVAVLNDGTQATWDQLVELSHSAESFPVSKMVFEVAKKSLVPANLGNIGIGTFLIYFSQRGHVDVLVVSSIDYHKANAQDHNGNHIDLERSFLV